MAQFSPVAPPQLLAAFKLAVCFGGYHLLLAKEVLEAPDKFHELFTKHEIVRTVFMDNNVAETKGDSPLTVEQIAEASKITSANVIILPDVYLDTEATIESCETALGHWTSVLGSILTRNWTYMIVPQGKTIEDWTRCAEHFATDARIGWWGIPRNLTDLPEVGTRMEALQVAHLLNPSRHIHLLGFSENIRDDLICAKYGAGYVSGIDSSVPVRCASLGIPFSLNAKLPPRGDWWHTAEYKDEMRQNLNRVRGMIA